MAQPPRLKWSWEEFCGTENFTVWAGTHSDLSQCFQTLCLQIPALFLIAVISAYYAGKYDGWLIRTSREKTIIKIRMVIVLVLALLPAIRIIALVTQDPKSLHAVNYFFMILESFTWFVHLSYVAALKNRLGFSLRGRVVLISLYMFFFVICVIRAKSLYVNFIEDVPSEAWVYLVFSFITLITQLAYGLTLIPSEDSPSRRQTLDAIDREDVMYTSVLSQYCRFREDFDPHYIGTAMEGSGPVSKLLFLWSNRLIDKGADKQLNSSEDVFDLPEDLTCSVLHNKLRIALDTPLIAGQDVSRITLLKGLHACFAKQFYGVGVLRLIADLASFASPLLLHELLTFIDDEKIPVPYGYFYAAGIFLASLIGSFCSIHFSFLIGKISLKLQSSLIARIYRKILLLNPSVFKEISVGEIVNHINTDMIRISNSCISFHSVWSIPFQLVVTLYLLYTQVGIAAIAGVAFSVVLIPINKVIAVKIGNLSVSMMAEKDKRVEKMNELIKGIRVIKLHVWEEYFVSKILGIRVQEMKYLKCRKYLDALCVYFWATTPVIISILTFTVHVYMGRELNAAIVFTSLSLLNMLIVPVNAIPWVLNGVIEAWVSVKRVSSYLQYDEINVSTYYTPKNDDTKSVIVENGTFSWNLDTMHLSNINLSVKKGQLVGIIGPVGSGKSSLLAALLGEIQGIRGFVSVDGVEDGIGYVSQTPWIQQCSVRENILFGGTYEVTKYRKVVEACALMEDFKRWSNGDSEVVGEAGCTLSGGQKARIALARAVYQDKSVYIMDDVLSAVDTQVAVHIFNECIKKLLQGRTRILVTHFTQLLKTADWVIKLNDGQIIKQGPPGEVLSDSDFSSKAYDQSQIAASEETEIKSETNGDEIEAEGKEKGVVSFQVYFAYWKAVGHILAALVILSVVAMQVSRHAVDWWLSVWVSANKETRSNSTDFYFLSDFEYYMVRDHTTDVYYFLTVYIALGVANSIIVVIRAFLFAYGGIQAATKIHESLLSSIVQAQVKFFDNSPLGRILNRFSSDTNTVDDSLPFVVNILLAQFFAVVGTLCMTMYGIPWLCLILAPLLPIYQRIQSRYRATSRELKRLGSVTLSPLYSHVTETITGIMTIRAFKESRRFIRENEDRVDTMQKCTFSSLAASLWLNIRLQTIGVIVIGGVCIIAVLQRHIDVAHSGYVGLALSYALTLTGSLGGVVNVFTETEQEMVAVERIDEYIRKPESELKNGKVEIHLPFAWPCQGVVTFINAHLKYGSKDDSSVPYSLKNVTFETHAGEKVGIVGRTGAGKSSLFVSLFRLCELTSGVICIDTINISNVPLHKLRSKITIIPQDPFIFAGTIRENIDPLNEREELQIWDALNKCDLLPFVKKLGGLNAELKSGGLNISVGERQLLCLVRAALRNTKVVCIDEATANVDQETDKKIQNAIRNLFQTSTVFIIAHRIQSVMECDRVLVMSHGEVLEFDSPKELLNDDNSHFYRFVNRPLTS